MKKILFASLLPAALVLAGCGPTPTSSSDTASSSESSSSSSSSSSSKTLEEIPTVIPELYVTIEGITVLDSNAVYVAGPNVAGTQEGDWYYAKAELQTSGTYEGTYKVTFEETEVDLNLTYKVYVQSADAFNWMNPAVDENGQEIEFSFIVLEGQTAYTQTVTFTSQPDSSSNATNVTVQITAVDEDNNPIDEDYLYLWAYDNAADYDSNTGRAYEKTETAGVYEYTYPSLTLGTKALTVNPFFSASSEGIDWNYPSDTTGQQGWKWDITAETSNTTLSCTCVWSSLPPEPVPSDNSQVTLTVEVTDGLPGTEWPQFVVDGNNWWGSTIGDETTDVYSYITTDLEAGEHTVYVYAWDGTNGTTITSDGDEGAFTFTVSDRDITVTITGSFGHAGTIAVTNTEH